MIKITASSLRNGGMQNRLHRQEVIRYNKAMENHTKKIALAENKKNSFSVQSFGNEVSESLDDFDEPVFRRIRSRRGFF